MQPAKKSGKAWQVLGGTLFVSLSILWGSALADGHWMQPRSDTDGSIGVRQVEVDPFAPTTFYAVLSEPSLYRSLDGGLTWQAIAEGLQSGVESIALDYQTPGALYAVAGGEVFKSADSGTNWTRQMDGHAPGATGCPELAGVAIDPQDSSHLFAADEASTECIAGLWESVDGAASWTRIRVNDAPGSSLWPLVVDPFRRGWLYSTNRTTGFRYSRDFGATWIDSNPEGTGPTGGSVTPHPAVPDLLLLASAEGILVSDDAGDSWATVLAGVRATKISFALGDPQSAAAATLDGIFRTSDGGRTWSKSADIGALWVATLPGSAEQLVLASPGREAYGGRVAVSQLPGGIWYSRDGGSTFIEISAGLPSGVSLPEYPFVEAPRPGGSSRRGAAGTTAGGRSALVPNDSSLPEGPSALILDDGPDVYDVTTYGAVCDGAQNDALAVQAAIDAASVSGGVVSLPAGECIVEEEIQLRAKVYLVGQGRGLSILKRAAVSYPAAQTMLRMASIDHAGLEALTLDGNRGNASAPAGALRGLEILSSEDVSLRNLSVVSHEAEAIVLSGTSGAPTQHVWIRDSLFTDIGGAAVLLGADWKDLNVSGNNFANYDAEAVRYDGTGGASPASGFVFSRNTAQHSSGLPAFDVGWGELRGAVISHNVFSGQLKLLSLGNATIDSNSISNASGPALALHGEAGPLVISNNTLESPTDWAIVAPTADTSDIEVSIVGNRLLSDVGGVSLFKGDRITIASNTVQPVGLEGSSHGILIRSLLPVENVMITTNLIDNFLIGIEVASDQAGLDTVLVSDNLIRSTVTGAQGVVIGAGVTNSLEDGNYTVALEIDDTPPLLAIDGPPDGANLNTTTPTIDVSYSDSGSGIDTSTLVFKLAGVGAASTCTFQPSTASCLLNEPLSEGAIVLSATVADLNGNVSTPAQVTFTVDTVGPPIIDVSLTAATEPSSGLSVVTGLAGAAEPGTTITITNLAAGSEVSTTALADGSFSASIPAEGNDGLGLVSADGAGNTSLQAVIFVPVAEEELPPDPTTTADPTDPTVATDFYEVTRFLWEGDPPIQWDVAPGAIDPLRAAVVRGRVQDASGSPLSGVTITIAGHPEFGKTLSRLDGAFDLAVNGGGYLAINYRKAGYLSSQRRVQPPWLDYLCVDDVRLLVVDSATTTVMSDESTPQVARGSQMTDSSGTRQATLMFKAATQATAVLTDGSTIDLPSLTVRATEYTVGDGGPEAMPGPLPASSGYTYAMELSVDEAMALGAVDVVFDKPVSFYVENFLDFPAGGIVPVGYYDRALATWVSSDNGLVVDVLSIVGGLVELDVDGSGVPADSVTLAALGIDDAERAELATLYQVGDSLWRVPVTHFTPYDCNWPYGPPDDAENPPDPDEVDNSNDDADDTDPEDNDDDAEDEEKPDCSEGSIIECQNQTLREALAIPGTPYSLNYSSARVPGRKVGRFAKIRLSEETVPASLKRIELEIDVAGQEQRVTFDPLPDQIYTFEWDGRDVYGRPLNGRHTATIRVGYIYDAVVLEASQNFEQAWAQFSGATAVFSDPNRTEFALWRQTTRRLVGYEISHNMAGGWTIDVHHRYDTNDNQILFGDGTTRGSATTATRTTGRLAGSPAGTAGYLGDGGPARDAWLFWPLGIDVGADGSVYVADWLNHRLRRIGPDGIIDSVAGNGTPGTVGDGGPATIAQLDEPYRVAVGPDNTLFIATGGGVPNVRKVDPSGIISTVLSGLEVSSMDVGPDGTVFFTAVNLNQVLKLTPEGDVVVVAGTGNAGWDGDGGPALQANLEDASDVVVDSRERIYVGSIVHDSVRVITPDGLIEQFAGNGQSGSTGDGGPATEASLTLGNLAVGPDDDLYVHELFRVRRIDSNGYITSVFVRAADGVVLDGDPATAARISSSTSNIAVSPEGHLYVLDRNNSGVAIVHPQLPGTTLGDFFVASDDGDSLYRFDHLGRHLQTLNALTGAVLLDFAYDSEGLLLSITDGDGLATIVERDGSGVPQAVQGPYGHRTEFAFDSQGYLSSVTMPGPHAYLFTYDLDGLLQSSTNPRNLQTTYGYSPAGRLITTQDAAGGIKTLNRRVSGDDYQVTLTSREGADTVYKVTHLSDGNKRKKRIAPGGLVTETLEETDGTTTTTFPDGTLIEGVAGPDPRFGMQAPILKSHRVVLPSGTTRESTHSRTVQLLDPEDPLSVDTVSDTFGINGRLGTSDYDASLRMSTHTTPEGRVNSITTDEQGRPIEISQGTTEPLRFSYDALGRLEALRQGTGVDERSTVLVYNSEGRIESLTDPEQQTTSFSYDNAGRVTQKVLPDGSFSDYSYDANGNLLSLTPPASQTHSFEYTPVDLLERHSPPELGGGPIDTVNSYDLDRELATVMRPDGESIVAVRDSAGRLTSITIAEGAYVLSYDPSSGLLSQIAGPGGQTVAYTYDGYLLTETAWSGEITGTVSRTYDTDFRIASRSVNGAQVAAFQYDADSLLTSAGPLQIEREPSSNRIAGTTLGAVTTSRTYDAFGQLETFTALANGSEVYNFSVVRDKLGRIVQKVETVEAATSTFDYSYDGAGRLHSVDRNGVVDAEYTYDDNGNRLSYDGPFGSQTGTYDAQGRLSTYGGLAYAFNTSGQLESKSQGAFSVSYDYDAFDNLRSVILDNGIDIEYVIDGQNRKVGKKIDGVLVQAFLYRDLLNPIAEMDGAGNITARFVYGTRTNVPDYVDKGGNLYRVLSDHLGSPRLVVDTSTGLVVQRVDYDEFGRVTFDSSSGAQPFHPFGFAGGLYDSQTDLARFGARDYDSEVGRWTSRDPLLFAGGSTNLYSYALEDPINTLDLDGDQVPFKPSKSYIEEWVNNFCYIEQVAKDPSEGSPYTLGEDTPLQEYYEECDGERRPKYPVKEDFEDYRAFCDKYDLGQRDPGKSTSEEIDTLWEKALYWMLGSGKRIQDTGAGSEGGSQPDQGSGAGPGG